MVVTGIWIALLIVGFLIVIVGRLRPDHVSTFNRAAAVIESRTAGRAVLILLWVFIGFHLFARYTVPHK
jgi:hypothetical protein